MIESIKKIFVSDDSHRLSVKIKELHRRWSPHSTEGEDLVAASLWDKIDLYMEQYCGRDQSLKQIEPQPE